MQKDMNNLHCDKLMNDKSDNLVEVKGLKTHFPIKRGLFSKTVGYVKAVDGVSFTIPRGKTLGLVGESGCGKTTVGRTLMKLIPATEGHIHFDGHDTVSLSDTEFKSYRRRMQLIFQDPYGSLNPRMTIGNIIGESLSAHKIASPIERRNRVLDIMDRVGLLRNQINRYPHEFSGGQRQRVGIARALALSPEFIVCDEPVSALDVSIQSQIINLLMELQKEMGLTYLFIAHDLAVVEHISDYVAVMYLGRIVEKAPSDSLYAKPLHPYTQALISAIPEPDPDKAGHRIVLKGEVPSPVNIPTGCPFHPRCPIAEKRCSTELQTLSECSNNPEHLVACWKNRV